MRKRPLFQADEPRTYDRRLYPRVLLAAFLIILIASGFVVWRLAFYTVAPSDEPTFDLSSVFFNEHLLPDPENPCMVLQDHLEATRLKQYRLAYNFLCSGLQSETAYDDFVANCKSNDALFKDVRGYLCDRYTVDGSAAEATGYIVYRSGDRSRVKASFARQDGTWRIARITVIFQ